eukprot:s42_g43.t1
MVLTVPMPDELMRRRKRAFSALARDGDADGVELLVFGRLPSGGDSNEEVTLNEIFVGVGASSTGKTTMLGELMKEHDPSAMTNFEEQRSNLMTHHTLQIGSRSLKFLDCSGNERAGHLVKEWFGRTQWVFVIYSLADVKSYQKALTLMAEARQAGAGVVLFANKYDVGKEGKEVQVNLREAHDRATQSQAYSVEGSSLSDAVRFVASQDDSAEAPAEGAAAPDAAAAEDAKQRSSIANAIDSVKSWFGGPPERGGKGGGVLRPSLKGTKAMKQARRDGDPNVDLRPVQELQDSESAVTCVCFGQERLHRSYILFVTASKDGNIVVYRCYRTEMEIAMLANEDFRGDTSPQPADHSNIAVHSRLVGHARAITSVFFNLLEDQLISTSIDKSVRFWNVDTGEMLKVFTDSSPVPVATFLPFNPQVFVAANSNAVLRLVNLQNGMVLQKLKVETEVRTLKFDDTGMFLLAGTKSGSIHVLEATDNNMLKFKFKVQLARGGDDGYPMSKTRVDRLTAMSGEGEVEKRRLNEDSKRLLEAEASHLASYYSQFGIHYAFLGIDKSVNPKVREAAVIYSLAEEHLLDLELEEALKKATQALELFREAKSKPGQQDAVRLLCSVERQKQDPDFSIDKIQTELRSCRDSEDKRGQGAMLLALAEAQLAKALAGEALSNIEEALPLLRAAGDKRQLQLG